MSAEAGFFGVALLLALIAIGVEDDPATADFATSLGCEPALGDEKLSDFALFRMSSTSMTRTARIAGLLSEVDSKITKRFGVHQLAQEAAEPDADEAQADRHSSASRNPSPP